MPKTLLLADDSVTIQKVVGISFASQDITLITVDNGDDAIARAREVRPDMVLADVVMPGKNGYEVCAAIKADPSLKHVPVLLLTGTFEAFDEERAQQVGAAGHVAKPFEAQTLVDQVNRLFAQGQAAPAPVAAAPAPQVPTPSTEPLAALPEPLSALPEAPAAAPLSADFFSAEPLAADPLDSPFADAFAEVAPAAAAADPLAPAANDEAFDFFSDDFDQPKASPAPEATVVQDAGAFDLAGDDAFSFGETLSSETGDALDFGEPVGAADLEHHTGDSTVAILPESDGLTGVDSDSIFGPSDEPTAVEPVEPRDFPTLHAELVDADFASPADDLLTPPALAVEPPAPSSAATELFDGDFGPSSHAPEAIPSAAADDSLLRIDSDDLAQATVIDPGRGAGFDVSSSDLADPMAGVFEEQPESAPQADTAGVGLYASAAPDVPPAPQSAPAAEARPHPSTEELAASAIAKIGPQIREQLHDTLEKVAWESFGSLTEEIVRQTVERVEAVAWEVIPQMAETLIREEIRKLKGDDSE